MKEFNKRNNVADSENEEEFYSIPNEVSCSAEFPEGCILSE